MKPVAWTLHEVVEKCAKETWRGFKAEWVSVDMKPELLPHQKAWS